MSFRFFYKIFKIALWSLLAWLFVRAFFFQSCRIPSESMCNTLQQGDYILINKLAYGARIPITPLSISLGNKTWAWNALELPYFRLPGYAGVQRNDIVIFNFPEETDKPVDQRKKQIKRCVALPGDTLRIAEGILYINGKVSEDNEQVLYLYRFSSLADTVLIKKMNPVSLSAAHLQFCLPKRKADSLDRTGSIQPFARKRMDINTYDPDFFPHSPLLKWNPEHFGSFWIPKKGQSITLDDTTFALYARTIEQHEQVKIVQLNRQYYIDGRPVKDYTFRLDYYFVMGDNRSNSIDSRYWGLLPETHLLGKYAFTLF